MTYSHILISRKPVDLGQVLNDEFNAKCRAEERLALHAPTLYCALTDLIQACEKSGDDGDALKKAKEAIEGL